MGVPIPTSEPKTDKGDIPNLVGAIKNPSTAFKNSSAESKKPSDAILNNNVMIMNAKMSNMPMIKSMTEITSCLSFYVKRRKNKASY